MENGSFVKTPEEISNFFSGMNKSLVPNQEGLYLAWKTDGKILKKILPPQLKSNGGLVMAYVIYLPKTQFSKDYGEAALFVPVIYENKPMVYMLSILLSGKADMPMALGREGNGYPKKIADEIKILRNNGNIKVSVKRHDIQIINVEAEIGDINNTEGENIFKEYKKGSKVAGDNLGIKYNIENGCNGVEFSDVELVSTRAINFYKSSEECNITKLDLQPSKDDPWAELKVVEPLGGAYVVYDSIWLAGKVLRRLEPNKYAPYLFTRWDNSVLGYPYRNYEFKN